MIWGDLMDIVKIMERLFELVEHQEKVDIDFTVEKKEGERNETV